MDPSIEPQNQEIFKKSLDLANNSQFVEALHLLNEINTVMSSYLKGKIYFMAAEYISRQFVFKHYPTKEIKEEHLYYLNKSYECSYGAACQLIEESDEVKTYLNNFIWNLLAKIEFEIASHRPAEEEHECEEDQYDVEAYIKLQNDMIADQLTELNFPGSSH